MTHHNKEGTVSKALDFLASPPFLYGLLLALLLLCVAGTLLPKIDIYHSLLFTALLGLLGINLTLCTWQRQIHAWLYGKGQAPRDGVLLTRGVRLRLDVLLTHLAVLTILIGGMLSAILGLHGSLPLSVGESKNMTEGPQGFRLPFSVKLEDFGIEYYDSGLHSLTVTSRREGWSEKFDVQPGATALLRAGAIQIKVLEYFPDFIIDNQGPATRSSAPQNPALHLEITDREGSEKHWAFARFPDFHGEAKSRYQVSYEPAFGKIKQFHSQVAIIQGGWVAVRRAIEVNQPLRWGGYTLYQAGYDPENPQYSSLLVSRDPGVPLVYAGFLLLTVGLTWTFLRRKK